MTIMNEREIREKYPPILSLENVRVILRISKRKAAWMLHNGVIKNANTGKQTRQYKIKMEDLLDYIRTIEEDELSQDIPYGIFSSRQECNSMINSTIPSYLEYRKLPNDFSEYLMEKWSKRKNLLYTKDVANLTGYGKSTIQKWIETGKLKSVWSQEHLITTKEWLIEFYQQYGHRITRKTRKHKLLINGYRARQEKK